MTDIVSPVTDAFEAFKVVWDFATHPADVVLNEILDKLTTPMLNETEAKRVATAGAVIGGLAIAPYVYPLIAPKPRGKRKKAEQEKIKKSIDQAGEAARAGIAGVFKSPSLSLPATFLLLEVLAAYPQPKVIHHPEVGHWEEITTRTVVV